MSDNDAQAVASKYPVNSNVSVHFNSEQPIDAFILGGKIGHLWDIRAPGHAELQQGEHRQEKRSHGLVTITSYRCDRCGTAWEYENNKVNQQAGWSVVGR